MYINLEVQALLDVGVSMEECCRALEEIGRDLNTIYIDFWQGKARTTFDQILEEMRTQTAGCTYQLVQSTNVISDALKKYNGIEIENVKESASLPADNIF